MSEGKEKKIMNPDIALLKAMKYCAYQERCQQEVRDKLYSFGLWPDAVEKIIGELIEQNLMWVVSLELSIGEERRLSFH
jgi:regulatory protein